MLEYVLEVSLCWSVGYLIFYLLLRKNTFFKVNRFYLLGMLVMGLLVPLLRHIQLDSYQKQIADAAPLIYIIKEMPATIAANVADPTHSLSNILMSILTVIYWIGVIVFLLRMTRSLFKIKKLYEEGNRQCLSGNTLVYTDQDHLPFSFGWSIFISRVTPLRIDLSQVLDHELTHVRHWHTMDVLLVELINAFFWWNPLIYFYKTAIRQTHEYLADRTVIGTMHRKIYSTMLLKQSMSGLELALAHQFFHSHIKKRINMMYQKQSGPSAWLKYLLALPVIFLMLIVFTNGAFTKANYDAAVFKEDSDPQYKGTTNEILSVTLAADNTSPITKGEHKEGYQSPTPVSQERSAHLEEVLVTSASDTLIYLEVDEMPRFPGCEEENLSEEEKNKCSDTKILEFIFNNLRYPVEALKNGIQGRIFVKFVVETDGTIDEISVVRDIGGGCGEEGKRVVQLMNAMPERWRPGHIDGKAVRVSRILPIQFKIENDVIIRVPVLQGDTTIHKVVEEIPRFPGCENKELSLAEKTSCSNVKLLEYLYKNLKYPPKAKKLSIQGLVLIQFIIEKDGRVENINIIRNIGGGCGEAAKKVVHAMNDMPKRWRPGYQNGKPVRVLYTLPVTFKLNSSQ